MDTNNPLTRLRPKENTLSDSSSSITESEEKELKELQEELRRQAQEWSKKLQDPMVAQAVKEGHLQVSPVVMKLIEMAQTHTK